jgi:N-acetylglutamate synthase/N-acetylornithine aminotransferase
MLTGIIGWRLPVAAITGEGVPLAAKSMQKNSILPAAVGITTTDRYPKVRALEHYIFRAVFCLISSTIGRSLMSTCSYLLVPIDS